MSGPQTKFSDALHAQKYRGPGESFREAMNRVASGLTQGEKEYEEFRDALLCMRFMPAGRIQAAIGAAKRVTPYNCYVSGTIEDSFVDGTGSIMARAKEAAATMRMGGGIGYDFSTLRPRGSDIKKLGSRSGGPVSFMDIFDAVCRCTASSGHRRGAQMGVLRVDHPDIEEFVRSKQNSDRLTGFNISVGVTDEFMRAVESDGQFMLRFGTQAYREVSARALWETIMRSTWDWAEPGVLFVDRINEMNNLWYCEKIAATNPCGEQPLPPYGACLLGSFNLAKYVTGRFWPAPLPEWNEGCAWGFDVDQFRRDVRSAVRAMDRVVDVATYPLFEQEKEAQSKRRMGLGVTGLANAGEVAAGPYGSERFLQFERFVLGVLRDEAYLASAELACERGSFPLFDREKFLSGHFALTLPEHVRVAISLQGLRNSHLLSIAPTGTISMCADNVSSGIEPVFSYSARRTIIGFDGPEEHLVEDYGAKFLGTRGKVASEVTAREHLDVLSVAYDFVDSAVSKTCNVPSDMHWGEFKEIYVEAWRRGCKGCTTFRPGGKRGGVLVAVEDEPKSLCRLDPVTGLKECE